MAQRAQPQPLLTAAAHGELLQQRQRFEHRGDVAHPQPGDLALLAHHIGEEEPTQGREAVRVGDDQLHHRGERGVVLTPPGADEERPDPRRVHRLQELLPQCGEVRVLVVGALQPPGDRIGGGQGPGRRLRGVDRQPVEAVEVMDTEIRHDTYSDTAV